MVIVLFVWMIILQDEVRSLKEKLQKYINESYVSQVKSPVPPDKKLDEMQVETFKANQEPIKEKTPEKVPQEDPHEEPDKIPAAHSFRHPCTVYSICLLRFERERKNFRYPKIHVCFFDLSFCGI